MTKAELPDPLIEIWRAIIVGEQKSWVLFRHSTCIILMEPEADVNPLQLSNINVSYPLK
jgi:hypothetical protein